MWRTPPEKMYYLLHIPTDIIAQSPDQLNGLMENTS